jgi:hypothetical protein
MPEQTYVYGLLCPIENKIRYVGKSDKPAERLRAHLSEMRCWRIRRLGYRDQRGHANNVKLNWLNELDQQGLTPKLVILETLPWESREIPLRKANWRKAEMRWVEFLFSKGHPLVNREVCLSASSEVLMREAIERGRNLTLSLGLSPSEFVDEG